MPTRALNETGLAGAIIHEVRRLLTPARAYAELAMRQPGLSPDVARSLQATIEAASSCDAAMLALVQCGRGAGEYSAASRIADSAALMQNVEVECRATGPIPLAAGALEVLLANLVSNARRADPTGRILISVDQRSTGNTAWVSIRVKDHGTGMCKEQVERAALPFVSNTSSSGLGLAICRHMVESVNGTMTIESELGRGTCVEVRLPSVAASLKAA